MADTARLRQLLSSASAVFSHALELGMSFEWAAKQPPHRRFAQPDGMKLRENYRNRVEEFKQGVLELQEAIQNPPAGFERVAETLRELGQLARKLPHSVDDGLLELWPDFYQVGNDGYHALKDLVAAYKLDDPFSFLDDLEDTTEPELHIDQRGKSRTDAPTTVDGADISHAKESESDGESKEALKEKSQELILVSLKPSTRRAWLSWKLAERNHAATPKDGKAYEWLENHSEEHFTTDLVEYELPSFDTWQRYVREARNALDENKYTPRAGRASASRSIVNQDDL